MAQSLRDQILAKMQQNKIDRAKHQEMVESLDRGSIYLQGQLDLVDGMEKSAKDAQAAAKKAQDDAAAAAAVSAAAPAAPVSQAALDNTAEVSAENNAPVELSPLPAAPEASPSPASN
jgi:hypothetical protein